MWMSLASQTLAASREERRRLRRCRGSRGRASGKFMSRIASSGTRIDDAQRVPLRLDEREDGARSTGCRARTSRSAAQAARSDAQRDDSDRRDTWTDGRSDRVESRNVAPWTHEYTARACASGTSVGSASSSRRGRSHEPTYHAVDRTAVAVERCRSRRRRRSPAAAKPAAKQAAELRGRPDVAEADAESLDPRIGDRASRSIRATTSSWST